MAKPKLNFYEVHVTKGATYTVEAPNEKEAKLIANYECDDSDFDIVDTEASEFMGHEEARGSSKEFITRRRKDKDFIAYDPNARNRQS